MERCNIKLPIVAVLLAFLPIILANAGRGAANRPFGIYQRRHSQQQHRWDSRQFSSIHEFRGGGRAPASSQSGSSRIPSTLTDPMTAAGAGVASVWQDHVAPTLKSWKDHLSKQQEEMPDRGRGSQKRTSRTSPTNDRRYSESGTLDTTTARLSALLVPSRVIKLTLLALLIAEALDRVGILYEDAPALLKSRLEDYWFYNLQPKLVRCKEKMQLFYWNRVEPHLPECILYSDFYNTPLSFSSIFTTKVAFAVGASIGMIASPLLAAWTCRVWKPLLGIYGLAEFNHYCNQTGKRFVQWLGETPQTLGATLNGVLYQVLNLVRGIVFGDRHVAADLQGRRNSLIFTGDSRLPLLGGGDEPNAKGRKNGKDDPLGFASRKDETEFQGLLDEFKDWMVVNGPREPSRPIQEKRKFAMKGFWLGCCLGFALFGL